MNSFAPLAKSGGVLFWLSLLNLLFLLALWPLERFYSEHHWLPTLLANMPQHPFGVPTLVLLLWALFVRNRWALMSGLIALWVWLGPLMGFNVLNPQVHSSSPTFRSMNFNIEQARHHSVAQIAAAIGAESPDVVCLEEARDIEGFEFARLSKEFPGWHTAHGYNVALLSRFPLENIQIHPMAYEATRRKILEATATIKGRKVKVICVHYITTSMFRGGWNKISTQHFADEARVRRNTTQDLLELTRQSPYPVVIGGDFNTPPRNALYRLLRAELTDSFAEGGWGFGYSWNTDFPLLRIDYLWSKGLKVHRAWVSKTVASDHHPVITDFTW